MLTFDCVIIKHCSEMSKNKMWLKKSIFINPLIAFYFFVGFIAFIAEFKGDSFFVDLTKALLIPLLLSLYWLSTKSKDIAYIVSLFLSWLATVFFVSGVDSYWIIGTILFILSHLAVIYVVIKNVRNPGWSFMILCSLPFIGLYLLGFVISYNKLGVYFSLCMVEGVFMIFYGSLCLTNYMTKITYSSTYLLGSAVLSIFTHLLLIINGLVVKNLFLKSLAILFFIIGQFSFYRYMFIEDQNKRQKRYKIINDSSF